MAFSWNLMVIYLSCLLQLISLRIIFWTFISLFYGYSFSLSIICFHFFVLFLNVWYSLKCLLRSYQSWLYRCSSKVSSSGIHCSSSLSSQAIFLGFHLLCANNPWEEIVECKPKDLVIHKPIESWRCYLSCLSAFIPILLTSEQRQVYRFLSLLLLSWVLHGLLLTGNKRMSHALISGNLVSSSSSRLLQIQ